MKGINDILKDRILQTFRAVQSEEKWKVCVVDSKSMKILSAACKLANLFEMDIVSIDNIDKPRQSHPKLEAIYILTPCLDSIQRLVNDFSKSEGPMYKCAHVHFTGALDGSLFSDMNRRVTEAGVAKYIRALKEIFVDFLAVDSATYTTDYSFQTPANFFTCFGTTEYNRAEEDLKDIAKQLLAVCAVLGENPMIRYHRPLDLEGVENRYLPSKLAKALQSELDEFVRQNPEFPPSRDPPVGPATMFILDRTIDSCSPFLHELTYQAMMNDLLNLENNGTKYSYEYNEEESGVTTTVRKDVVLDESDNVFVEVRHLYIQEAIDKLTTEFRELIGKGGIAKTGDSLKDLNAMKDVVARLPQYQEMKAKYGVHLDIAQKCIDIFTQQELRSIVELEQDLACGETHDGHTLKNIVDRMTPLLDDPYIRQVNMGKAYSDG
ncbi:hypothetical protein BZG36_03206 [Bifiguratus adelaidae]|uniref:Sec1-like protein n=1 Tax=Bifiguratus adelaidae TaxID=1938954 RepID=A0A261Y1I3_9FUNG|nr:hypothetical protein BZG36_03206 [Bifiguratus adelaidae]